VNADLSGSGSAVFWCSGAEAARALNAAAFSTDYLARSVGRLPLKEKQPPKR
jgi:hypothetical protein